MESRPRMPFGGHPDIEEFGNQKTFIHSREDIHCPTRFQPRGLPIESFMFQHLAMMLSAEAGYPVTLLASVKLIPASKYLRISSIDFLLVIQIPPIPNTHKAGKFIKLTGAPRTFR
jgi:hypothetical protein